jgi:hypothetical protein
VCPGVSKKDNEHWLALARFVGAEESAKVVLELLVDVTQVQVLLLDRRDHSFVADRSIVLATASWLLASWLTGVTTISAAFLPLLLHTSARPPCTTYNAIKHQAC